jgi:CheY-like chemotaxis protein
MASDRTPSILIVDDEPDIGRNMADILGDLGFQVDIAHDGPAALELLHNRPYDVALLDFKMPGMDGLVLYQEIKKLRPATVAMLVTAYTSATVTNNALAAGAWQVLDKPVDLPKLFTLIDEALGQPLLLVVDDDEDLCGNLWDLFRDWGYRVSLAHTAGQAIEQLRNSADVVLIDLKLPDGDGTSVFERLREVNPEARTVLVTGFREETTPLIDELRSKGADAVCYKPFNIPQLLETLKRLASKGASGQSEATGSHY